MTNKRILVLVVCVFTFLALVAYAGGGVDPEPKPPRPQTCNAVGDPDLAYCTVLEFLEDGVCIFQCKYGTVIR